MRFSARLRAVGAASLVAVALGAGCAWADPAPSAQLKAARDVVDASGVASGMQDIVPIFLDEAKRTFVRTRPELANDLDDAVKVIAPEFQARREQLLNDIAGIYANSFTAQELADIKAFYQTPTGTKLVKVLPGLLQESYDKTNAWSRQMSQDVITRLRQEMKKKGHDI